ncbi:MAG: DapH/DapD/GlmU-related protein, partial [Paracoccaceae bacterium]
MLCDTTIGHDVRIGQGALTLLGVTLGHDVIVGAGAVVARDMPDCAIVAGDPACIF